MVKLHLGCGPVYLKDGWTNIDLEMEGHYLAKDRPDLVEANGTTVDKYYKKRVDRDAIEKKTYQKEKCVVDEYGDITDLKYTDGTVDEIMLVQVFEHFTRKEGRELLNKWYKLLKPGGILHLDVPDLDRTVAGYYHSRTQRDKDWYARLLYGSQKDNFGLHHWMYSPRSLEELLIIVGFKRVIQLPNIHFYPAFAIEAIK